MHLAHAWGGQWCSLRLFEQRGGDGQTCTRGCRAPHGDSKLWLIGLLFVRLPLQFHRIIRSFMIQVNAAAILSLGSALV